MDMWDNALRRSFSSVASFFPHRGSKGCHQGGGGVWANCWVGRGEEEEGVAQCLWLGVEPRVIEAFASRGPLLRHHLQHGQKEVSELTGVFVRPAVLLHQHVKQGPRLQLGDVPQFTCRRPHTVTGMVG